MPIKNDLEPVKLPMDLKFNEIPATNYINNLESLNVELIEKRDKANNCTSIKRFIYFVFIFLVILR